MDDVAATVKELDVNASPVVTDWQGIKFCTITDPDGNHVQLHE